MPKPPAPSPRGDASRSPDRTGVGAARLPSICRKALPCLVPLVLLALAATVARGASVWVEGEAAAEKHVTKHGWYDAVHKDGMSGGDWVSHYGDKPGTVSYKFDAPDAGDYTFWWRGNAFAAEVSYQLNGADAVEIDLAHADKRGEYSISDKPDHRFLAWVKVGKVPLKKGPNTISFTFHSKLANHGGIDCFLLDNSGFVPSGVLKPDAGGAGAATAGPKPAGPDQAIWIEGEDATEKHVTKHGWYDAVHKDGMSGGNWLSHYDKAAPGTASYAFDVVKAGEYTFWWRGNVLLAKVAYQLNGGGWKEMEFGDKRGEYQISDKPDHRALAWVKVGKVTLPAGKNTVAFKFHSDTANHGGIDCFCFVNVPFTPSGVNKPTAVGGETAVTSGPGDWFPVVFDEDGFSDQSVIDMSKYIDAPAGKYGFLKRSGADLKFEKAQDPIQFWGVGANLQYGKYSHAQLTQRAKYLRKHGVQMVRQHPVADEIGLLTNGQFDAKRLDEFDWWCAELKKNGIYMTWSVFYGQKIGPNDGYEPALFNELEVADKQRNLRTTYGLANVEPKLQELQLTYLRALMTHKNPYTGLRPVDDPEIAVVEFQNEDTVFFFNPLNGLKDAKKWPLHAKRLRQRWFEWAKAKYGSEAALKKTWESLRGGDNWAAGELELMGAHNLGENGPLYEYAGQTKRAGDFIHFLADLQKTFYDRREKELRDMGYKAVTITTAWRSGGPAGDPANLYCDTAADMIDRHNYFGGGAGNHSIVAGEVHNGTHLEHPGSGLLSLGMYQVEDRPFSVTEWTQLPPNQWKLEAAPLMAFYGMGLQGWDSSYHFLSSRPYPGDGWPDLSSYVTDTPHYVGQWPALFLAVHNRHVKAGPPAAARHLKTADLFTGVDPLKQDFTGGGHDVKALQGQLVTPAEALAIGRVTVAFDGDKGGKSTAVDFAKYWDKDKKVVRSMTGELTWDYGRYLVTVATPKTHAIIGRTGGQPVELPGLTATVKTPFVSLIFTPLDDKPLAESKDVLVTALAQDKQTNTEYSPDGKKLLQIGSPPLLMEPVQATVKLKGAAPATINVLDVYGVPTGRTVKPGADGAFVIDGTYRTYYYEVKR